MNTSSVLTRLTRLIKAEVRALTQTHSSDRSWHMPLAAALSTGLPVLIGAHLDQMAYGLLSSVGGLVFLYLPSTPLYHRMATVLACAFVMCACYALGAMSHFWPVLMVPVLTFIAISVTMLCRFYAIGPPGGLFFVMAAAIGAYTPMAALQLPLMVGLITLGALLACLIALAYSLYMLRLHAPRPVPPLPPSAFDVLVFEPIVIGCSVGISLLAAQALELQKAYWVPVSCLAVIQGVSFRAIWNKQIQRLLGTVVGLLIAWGIMLVPLGKWSIPLMMMALTFVIETSIVRHYAFAVVFITPMTILLAEAATLGQGSAGELMQTRLFDTVLGCIIGLFGGACLHSPALRTIAVRQIRRFVPRGWVP